MAHLADTTINGVRVSTIHVTDHLGVATIETMLFGKGTHPLQSCRGWDSIPEAIEGHNRIVANIHAGKLTVWADDD